MNRIPLLAVLAAVVASLALPAGAAANLTYRDGDVVREGLGDSGATVTWATPTFDASRGRYGRWPSPAARPASG